MPSITPSRASPSYSNSTHPDTRVQLPSSNSNNAHHVVHSRSSPNLHLQQNGKLEPIQKLGIAVGVGMGMGHNEGSLSRIHRAKFPVRTRPGHHESVDNVARNRVHKMVQQTVVQRLANSIINEPRFHQGYTHASAHINRYLPRQPHALRGMKSVPGYAAKRNTRRSPLLTRSLSSFSLSKRESR